jgi:hypothetical protein
MALYMKVSCKNKKENRFWFPLALLLVAAAGLGITLAIGRTDLATASLLVVIPLVSGAVVILRNKNQTAVIPAGITFLGMRFSSLFLVNCLIFLISLIVLVVYPTRPITYFLLVSLSSAVILLQIVSRRSGWTDSLILVQIVFLSLNLIWGVSLKYPLYFGDTDSLIHLNLIDTLVKTGHIDSFILTYQHYPLYHIFNAIGIEITNLTAKTALFIFMGLAWQVGVVFAYLIFRDLSRSHILALIACLIFATTSQIIFYGGYAIARSLALVLLIGWIYLILRRARQDFRFLFLSLVLMSAMIGTHHVNVLFVIPMLLLVYICQIFLNRSQTDQPLEPFFIFLVTIASLTYMIWVAFDMTAATIPGTIASLLASDTSLSLDFTGGYGLTVLLGAIYYSFVMLLCILGIRAITNRTQPHSVSRVAPFAFAGFILLLIYVPSFLDLLSFSDVIFLKRFQLMVTPLVALISAYGVIYLFKTGWSASIRSKTSYLSVIPVIFIAVMTFFSLIGTGNAQDNDNLPHTANIDTPYFSSSELGSFFFLTKLGDNSLPLHSDYQTVRNEYLLGDFADKQILRGPDLSYIAIGYIFLRIGELERKNGLTLSHNGRVQTSYRYQIDPSNPDSNIIIALENKEKIYTNNSVFVFFVNQ